MFLTKKQDFKRKPPFLEPRAAIKRTESPGRAHSPFCVPRPPELAHPVHRTSWASWLPSPPPVPPQSLSLLGGHPPTMSKGCFPLSPTVKAPCPPLTPRRSAHQSHPFPQPRSPCPWFICPTGRRAVPGQRLNDVGWEGEAAAVHFQGPRGRLRPLLPKGSCYPEEWFSVQHLRVLGQLHLCWPGSGFHVIACLHQRPPMFLLCCGTCSPRDPEADGLGLSGWSCRSQRLRGPLQS